MKSCEYDQLKVTRYNQLHRSVHASCYIRVSLLCNWHWSLHLFI